MGKRSPKKSLSAALVACLTISALLAATASLAAPRVKPHPLYWGAWIGDQITGEEAPWDMSAVKRFATKVGKGLSLIEFATPLAECDGTNSNCQPSQFPTAAMQAIRDYGAIPFLSWSTASTPGNLNQADFQLSDIVHKRHDDYLKAFAKEAAAWGHPFFLRFDWEMNGNWFPWAEHANDNKPGEYVAAWRHVHDIFARAGATNATWVWCPYANTRGALGKFGHYYPGDRYVDWTCLDAYNFAKNPDNPRPWQSFDALFWPSYKKVTRRIAPDKPMILGEIASNGPPKRKATWIRQMFRSVTRFYPKVHGLIWFDHFDRGLSWPIEIDRAPTLTFKTGLQRTPFLGPNFGNLEASPIPPPG